MNKHKMYSLVQYSLSPMQKGVQAWHAGQELYNKLFLALKQSNTPQHLRFLMDVYNNWSLNDKVIIVLDGGTSNSLGFDFYTELPYTGTMQDHLELLTRNEVLVGTFRESDINNCMSAISFLVEEKVWDVKTFPDPILEKGLNAEEREAQLVFGLTKLYGERVGFLRPFLRKFPLAR